MASYINVEITDYKKNNVIISTKNYNNSKYLKVWKKKVFAFFSMKNYNNSKILELSEKRDDYFNRICKFIAINIFNNSN